jgi:uncharacterized protein Yka (UPF0111/DUF47 family)
VRDVIMVIKEKTIEKALEQLRLGPGINEDVSAEYNDAVDTAIEALEALREKKPETVTEFSDRCRECGKMTKEEKQKAIDALKMSVPVIPLTQEEFNDYIQTLNKIMDWLEKEGKYQYEYIN